jgi:hypothetical protein
MARLIVAQNAQKSGVDQLRGDEERRVERNGSNVRLYL